MSSVAKTTKARLHHSAGSQPSHHDGHVRPKSRTLADSSKDKNAIDPIFQALKARANRARVPALGSLASPDHDLRDRMVYMEAGLYILSDLIRVGKAGLVSGNVPSLTSLISRRQEIWQKWHTFLSMSRSRPRPLMVSTGCDHRGSNEADTQQWLLFAHLPIRTM